MIVAQGIASGEFREVDPRFVYLSVVSACEGLLDARYAMVLAYDTHEITREIRHAYMAQSAPSCDFGQVGERFG
ncbi:MAG TPA: hypothetical protein PK880_15565, partial [Candidatus Competibacter sp.]|nr:hypothetical protein [Candidatus Competibacter sp.]